MSPASPAEIIPFTRFLERRRRLNRLAVAIGTSPMPVSSDVGIRPEETETSTTTVARRRSVSVTVDPTIARGGVEIA
jgi:hypothetical protein